MEAEVRDAVTLEADVDSELVATERVPIAKLDVAWLELAEVPRALVVVEDVLAVESVHGSDAEHGLGSCQRVDQPIDVVPSVVNVK